VPQAGAKAAMTLIATEREPTITGSRIPTRNTDRLVLQMDAQEWERECPQSWPEVQLTLTFVGRTLSQAGLGAVGKGGRHHVNR
jgi:hypothetical protein